MTSRNRTCALLLILSLILSGKEIESGFAATGDMTAAGDVRSVGGVRSKISGAIRKKCSHIGVPKGNEATLSDSYLLDGLEPLYSIQVFTIATFDEASDIAYQNHPENVQKSMSQFSEVQKVLQRQEGYVFNNKVREKLREIVKLTPNHLSARLLLLHSLKRGPKLLSLEGSISGINKSGDKLSAMLKDQSWLEDGGNDDVLFKFQSELARLRPMLDKRTLTYADAYAKVANFFKDNRDRKVMTVQAKRELKSAIARLNSARRKLYNDPDVREELMMDK
jgi:hypothetical protein